MSEWITGGGVLRICAAAAAREHAERHAIYRKMAIRYTVVPDFVPNLTPGAPFRMERFYLGRWLIHLGLKTLPPGPCRAELSALLWTWGMKVSATCAANK